MGIICRRSPTYTALTWGSPTAGNARSGRIICGRPYAGSLVCLLPCLWGAPWDTPEGMTLVHFPQAQAAHPTAHVPPVGAAVEAFFVHRDLAPNSRRGGDG